MTFLHSMLALACLACLVAILVPFGPFKSRRKALIGLLATFLLFSVTKPKEVGGDSTSAAGISANNAATSKVAPDVTPALPVWTYDTGKDEMQGTVIRYACTVSTNTLTLTFPYGSGVTGKLCFRRKGKNLNAYIQVSAGQFNCGIDNCHVRFRFDDSSVQTFSAEESTTHETGFLFLQPEQRLLAAVSRAKTLKLQAEYFQEGSQVLNFDVYGLDIHKL